MSKTHISDLLSAWEHSQEQKVIEGVIEVSVAKGDTVRIEALSETYQLSRQQVIAQLLHNVLQQVEDSISYQPGSRVIRTEEGEPVYEDVGKMPVYLEAKKRLSCL